jgi:hypothetical protein
LTDHELADRPLFPAPGDGIVARHGSAVFVGLGGGDDDVLDRLLDACRRAGEAAAPGRQLARTIAGILAQEPPESVPSFCAFAPTDTGLAAIVCGDAELVVEGGGGDVLLAGRDAATWVDRVIAGPIGRVQARPPGTTLPEAGGRFELRGGVVPGGGATLLADNTEAPTRSRSAAVAPAAAAPAARSDAEPSDDEQGAEAAPDEATDDAARQQEAAAQRAAEEDAARQRAAEEEAARQQQAEAERRAAEEEAARQQQAEAQRRAAEEEAARQQAEAQRLAAEEEAARQRAAAEEAARQQAAAEEAARQQAAAEEAARQQAAAEEAARQQAAAEEAARRQAEEDARQRAAAEAEAQRRAAAEAEARQRAAEEEARRRIEEQSSQVPTSLAAQPTDGAPASQPGGFQSILLADFDEEPTESRMPLPLAGQAPPPGHDHPDDLPDDMPPQVEVDGITCARGHFNNPNSLYCSVCGLSMVQQTSYLVKGVRPPLGVFVFDDGTTFTVDSDYVIGREPEGDPRVVSGDARPMAIPDPERAISRVHAEIHLKGWDVIVEDRGSANGTYILPPGGTEWLRLPSDTTASVPTGARVLVGRRHFIFDSHHVA